MVTRRIAALATLVAMTGTPAPAPEWFTNVAAAAGIDFQYEHSPTSNKYLPESMGGGVALFDYDNDGRLDIFFTNGAKLADPMPKGAKPDKSPAKFWNRLYHQLPNGKFEDVTAKSGLSGAGTASYTMGVAAADFDNDGDQDLYVTGYGANQLYRNNGDGTFTDIAAKAGVTGEGWSASAGFFDYNRDGQLDIFVTRYLVWTFENNLHCGEPKIRAYCHPKHFSGIANLLYRNNGDGTFTEVAKQAGVANPLGKSLGVAFADLDSDGWVDVFVANDSVPTFLYRNNHDATFTDISLQAGTAYSEEGRTVAGMGADFADYDNDGRPDIVMTDLSTEMYLLFRNLGNGSFADGTQASGLGKLSRAFSGWGIRYFDYDNDGWKDVFVAQGHVLDTGDRMQPHLAYRQAPLLLRNESGRFRDVSAQAGAAFATPYAGRGVAVGDLDNDGDLDLVVSNLGQRAYVLRNDVGSRNHWLGLRLEGARANRDAIGAVVTVRTNGGVQTYMVNTGGSYLSASDKRLLVGLGAEETAAQVEIRWPGGTSQTLTNVKGGRYLLVREEIQ